jgi:hypothetical protein
MLTAHEHNLIEKTLGIEIPDRVLPASAASLQNLPAVAGPFASTMAAGDEFQNRKILVIDDEAINVRLVQKCLQDIVKSKHTPSRNLRWNVLLTSSLIS